MKKNFLQDVVPPAQKRSIRDVPLPRSKAPEIEEPITRPKPDVEARPLIKPNPIPKASSNTTPTPKPSPRESEQYVTNYVEPHQKPPAGNPPTQSYNDGFSGDYRSSRVSIFSKFKKLVYLLVVFVIVLGIIVVSRSKAEVVIEIKKDDFFVNESYEIYNQNQVDKPEGVLSYSIVETEEVESIVVNASGEEEVSEKASGIIEIINNHSDQSQKLVATTRFEAPNGKIYRIADSVEVPGSSDGKPGTVEVKVFADEPGEKFNQGKVDFTIPGFKGLPQFETITARSITDMTGGFVGVKKVVSDDDREGAEESLKTKLISKIKENLEVSDTDLVVVIKESDIVFSDIVESTTGESVELTLKANVPIYTFDLKEISNYLAQKNLNGVTDQDLIITNTENINFTIQKNITEDSEEDQETQISLIVDGDINFEWVVNETKLKDDLSGSNRSDLKSILENHKGILKAEASISPFWKNKFPEADKIDVIISNN